MNIVRDDTKKKMDFSDLAVGDCFVAENDPEIMMKIDFKQNAVSLESGKSYPNYCGTMVIVIKTELHIFP